MSLSVINNNFCKLIKVRPLITINDNKLYNKYKKERFKNAQNKNIFSFKISSSNYINIKSLMNPNIEKAKEQVNTNMNSLRQNKIEEFNKSNDYKKVLTENKKLNFNIAKSSKNINLPNVKIPKLNFLVINSQSNFNNKALKINKSTNISREKNKSKNKSNEINYNTINYPKRNDKIFKKKSNILLLSKSSKIKNSLLKRNRFPLKNLLFSNEKKLQQKMNFITNVKPIDSGIVNYKVFDTLFNEINKSKKNNLIKKDENLESLSENSIWNDYTKLEKDKTNEMEKENNYMEEKKNILSKLFKNSYSYKKNKNKGFKNQKEKYINYLDDYSLALRVNYIKNNLLNDRGGKQKLRTAYNPLNK
jgi:hypothetical protein